jgi:hypothetical protein
MTIRFCTLFDGRYAARGLVMLESLEVYRHPADEIIVLAIDEIACRTVKQLGRPHWRILGVKDLQDSDLNALEHSRPRREFCWTCTPALSTFLVRNGRDDDVVAYLDADLLFFQDPRLLLRELDGGSVLIHEHRFSPDRVAWQSSSGRFNVGFVAFKVGPEARACAERWRTQTIGCCELDPAKGLCGDQAYLTEWPSLYPNLRIMKNIGGGVAPWNIAQYRVGRNGKGPTVDGQPIVFFHYHALRTIAHPALGFVAIEPAVGYKFPPRVLKAIYGEYHRRLGRAVGSIVQLGLECEPDRIETWRHLLPRLLNGTYAPIGMELSGMRASVVRAGKRVARFIRSGIRFVGHALIQVSEFELVRPKLDLSGDRDVEWAWTAAQIPEQAGRVLDLGPATSTMPLIAAFNATEVVGLDLNPEPVRFAASNLVYRQGDILNGGLPDGTFDTIVNCSTTEHIGLSGRYGSTEEADGDLRAMALLCERMSGPNARMILTIPVGRDLVARPYHRIYGLERLPRLLGGFRIVREAYYAKTDGLNVWKPVSKGVALAVEGSGSFYALGLFVLAPESRSKIE